jgi:hypothetical protein
MIVVSPTLIRLRTSSLLVRVAAADQGQTLEQVLV